MDIVLTEEECDKLVRLYNEAQNTPVVALTGADALSGNDWSSQAWRRVEQYQDELGKKYEYDPATHGINAITREVISVER